MTIRKALGFINLLTLLLIALTGVMFARLLKNNTEVNQAYEQRFISVMLANELWDTSKDLTSYVRTYAATGDPAAEEAYNKVLTIRAGEDPRPATAAIAPGERRALLDLMKEYGITDEEFKKVELTNTLSNDLVPLEVDAFNAVKGLYRDGEGNYTVRGEPDRDLALRLVFGGDYVEKTREIQRPVDEFQVMVNRRMEAMVENMRRHQRLAGLFVSAALLVVLAAAGFNLVYLQARVLSPLVKTTGYAKEVSGGDLSKKFALNTNGKKAGKNELGILAESLSDMVQALRSRIAEAEEKSREALEQSQKADEGQRAILAASKNIENVVVHLSTAAEELSSHVEKTKQNAIAQGERVTGSAEAMEEMNSSVLDVARQANTTAETSETAKKKAEEGAEIVQDSVRAIDQVHSDTMALKENMEALGSQINAIGEVITLIKSIAAQTNILSMNATIEAAHAGDAGRGFAVVADEVRKLAEKTMSATSEIETTITGVQEVARDSIRAVNIASRNINSSIGLANRSGEALSDIVTEFVKTADSVHAIASAAEQQSQISKEITSSLEEVSKSVGENTEGMEESANAVKNVVFQISQLQELMVELRRD